MLTDSTESIPSDSVEYEYSVRAEDADECLRIIRADMQDREPCRKRILNISLEEADTPDVPFPDGQGIVHSHRHFIPHPRLGQITEKQSRATGLHDTIQIASGGKQDPVHPRPQLGQLLKQFDAVAPGDLVINDYQREALLLRIGKPITGRSMETHRMGETLELVAENRSNQGVLSDEKDSGCRRITHDG